MRAEHFPFQFERAGPPRIAQFRVGRKIEMPLKQTSRRALWLWILFGTFGLGIILFFTVPIWYEGSKSSRGLARLTPVLASDSRFSHVKAAPLSYRVILLRGHVASANDLEILHKAVKATRSGCMVAYDVGVINSP